MKSTNLTRQKTPISDWLGVKDGLDSAGFSLAEILIALLASTLFFLVTLQSTFISSRYQTTALQKSVFNRWIQSDLEGIQAQGRQLHLAQLTAPANPGQSAILVNQATGFASSDWVILGADSVTASPTPNPPQRVYRIAQIQANQFTLTAPLTQAYSTQTTVIKAATPQTQLIADSPLHTLQLYLADTTTFPPQSHLVVGDDTQIYSVVRRTDTVVYIRPDLRRAQPAHTAVGAFSCQAATRSTGLAAELLSQVVGTTGGLTDTQTVTKTDPNGLQYRVQRTLGIVNQAPFNLLSVSYGLHPQARSAAVDPFITAVLPQAALYCP